MIRWKFIVSGVGLLVIGFAGGFVARRIIAPGPGASRELGNPSTTAAPLATRGTQYFAAHIDEAREIIAFCREGTVRGEECANAEEAVISGEFKERFRRFRRDR